MLIDASANIQARNNATGCVPLHAAAGQGHLAAVQALLAHAAPHMPRTTSGELPVDFAREHGHHECADYLEHYRPPAAATFKYQWYHGTLDRAESTATLRQHVRSMAAESQANGNADSGTAEDDALVLTNFSSGVFLVRISAKTGDYVLTLLYENQPKNFIIQKYVSTVSTDDT